MTLVSDSMREALADCVISDYGPYDVNIFLLGGPTDFPEKFRFKRLTRADEKVKIPYRSGYEHFERTEEHYHLEGDCQGLIYRWTTRTKIAE
ncbi:DUF5988 family protein [Nonomuraea rhizosphaerae]|uniref:DUF5988 family protein n=1 Tax=Nonomuraea rhizosphaerae TaxID=2665663 RepID=UPI001C5E2512|nr:DUF5988 family protein [Nonomuraea rhizosphaerae]